MSKKTNTPKLSEAKSMTMTEILKGAKDDRITVQAVRERMAREACPMSWLKNLGRTMKALLADGLVRVSEVGGEPTVTILDRGRMEELLGWTSPAEESLEAKVAREMFNEMSEKAPTEKAPEKKAEPKPSAKADTKPRAPWWQVKHADDVETTAEFKAQGTVNVDMDAVHKMLNLEGPVNGLALKFKGMVTLVRETGENELAVESDTVDGLVAVRDLLARYNALS